jgi:hypothetical protein
MQPCRVRRAYGFGAKIQSKAMNNIKAFRQLAGLILHQMANFFKLWLDSSKSGKGMVKIPLKSMRHRHFLN